MDVIVTGLIFAALIIGIPLLLWIFPAPSRGPVAAQSLYLGHGAGLAAGMDGGGGHAGDGCGGGSDGGGSC